MSMLCTTVVTMEDSFIHEGTGYPVHWFVDSCKEIDLQCAICHEIICEAMATRCGHCFCKCCIQIHIQTSSDSRSFCPTCRATPLYLDNSSGAFIDRMVKNLKIHCPSQMQKGEHKGQCNWQGSIHEMQKHRSECKLRTLPCTQCKAELQFVDMETHAVVCPERHMKCSLCRTMVHHAGFVEHSSICPEVEVPCPDCMRSMKRNQIRYHYDYVCIIPCPNRCGTENLTRDSLQLHLDTICLLPCPNGCGAPGMTKLAQNEHLRKGCPLQVHQCPYQRLGCSHRCNENMLSRHLYQMALYHSILVEESSEVSSSGRLTVVEQHLSACHHLVHAESLLDAVCDHKPALVAALCYMGAPTNFLRNGYSALWWAACIGDSMSTLLLVEAKANVNEVPPCGRTPIHMAVSQAAAGFRYSTVAGCQGYSKYSETIMILVSAGARCDDWRNWVDPGDNDSLALIQPLMPP
jgi:hypothetical protein